MQIRQSRRDFLASASWAAAAGVFGGRSSLADEGPPEITTIRIGRPVPDALCVAPQYVAEDLLHGEGFTDIRYVSAAASGRLLERRGASSSNGNAGMTVGGVKGVTIVEMTGGDEVDFVFSVPPSLVFHLDAGVPVTVLAGVHSGCYELFAHEPIRAVSDLRGKSVGVQTLNSAGRLYVAIMAAEVGLDPHKDIDWIVPRSGTAMELFANGEVDAFLGFPPEPQELRARKIGRVILATATDGPWSQYFCCMVIGNREFVRAHPIATKRFLRAILKATDICAADPKAAAQRLVDGGFAKRYDYALETLTEVPYDRWREFDSEDSLRFYALRLHEVGMIKSSPNQLIAEGTDWRFLNELKHELKA